MRGRTLLTLMTVLALVIVAPEVATAKAGGTDRPLTGEGSGTATFDVGSVPFPGTATGTGNLSHLGAGTYSREFVILPGANGTFSIAGTATFVAANGDALFSAFTGSGQNTSATTSEVTAHSIITGGTGRFDGATGTFDARVVTQITSVVGTTVTANQTNTLEGTISY